MYRQLMDRIAKSDDVDVAQLFHEDRQPLKSPTDRDKRRAERVELEDTYINVRCVCSALHLCCVVRFVLHGKLCVLVFSCAHGSAPRYLQEVIRPVENIEQRRCLRSASSADLTVPATRRSTLGDRAFAVAGPRAWNTLPDAIRRCSSPDSFKRSLKTHLYIQSYFNAII